MHPIENILQTTMSELKQIVDVNTIVGNPFVTPSGCTIIPISKVSLGFVTGGGEYDSGSKKQEPMTRDAFAGGTASGVSITPVAFMVADGGNNNVKLLTATHRSITDKILENIPNMVAEIKEMCCKCGNEKVENSEEEQN